MSRAVDASRENVVLVRGAGFVALLLFLVFLPSCFAPLVAWDDDRNLENNTRFRGFRWSNLVWMATAYHEGHYQPLTWLTYAVDYSVWGEEKSGELVPVGYHATNVLLHSLNGVLAFCVAWAFATRLSPDLSAGEHDATEALPASDDASEFVRERPAPFSPALAAVLLGVVLWGLHPLRVESVTWVTERRQVLATSFLLAAVLMWLSHTRHSPNGSAWYLSARYWSAWGLFVASLLSSAWAITLPVLLLIWDAWPLRRLTGGRNWSGLVLEKVPFLVMSAACLWTARQAQQSAEAWLTLEALDLPGRIALALHAMGWYPATTIWPYPLAALRPIPPDWGLSRPEPWLYGLPLLFALAGAGWISRQRPGWLVALLCYLMILAPVSGVAQSGRQLVADRYSYLSTLPLFLSAGVGLAIWLKRSSRTSEHDWTGKAVLTGAAPVLAMLAGLCLWTQSAWFSSEWLWGRTVHYFPAHNALAHNNLGVALNRNGRASEALTEFQIAREQKSDYVDPIHNTGNVYLSAEKLGLALKEYDAALVLNPEFVPSWINRGLTLQKWKRIDEARDSYSRAIELQPGNRAAWLNRAKLEAEAGRGQAAYRDYVEYRRLGGVPEATLERAFAAAR